jgi:hypothetical protein
LAAPDLRRPADQTARDRISAAALPVTKPGHGQPLIAARDILPGR